MENNQIKLFTEGTVEAQERIFTRLVGGFGEDKPTITVKQISDLMGYDVKVVNQTINRNIEEFTKEEGFILDLKEITESDHNLEILKSIGYSKMSVSKAKNIYILSQAGFLLYLKFAEGNRAIELYKSFMEDYFKTKAENESMKDAIEKTLEQLKEEKAMLLGKTIMSASDSEKIELLQMVENKNNQIIELEKSMSESATIEKLSSKLELADAIENSKSNYDIGKLSKVLNIKGIGRNKMFEWMKDTKLLMKDNSPYQQYMEYFSVIPVITPHGYTTYKTLVKPKGVDFIMKRLIKDGKLISKSVEQVLDELEGRSAA